MADFEFAGVWAPGTFAFNTPEGALEPAVAATVELLNSSSDVPTYYTSRTKGDTTTPDLVTDANGTIDPVFVDPGAGYTYTITDSSGNVHGPFDVTVNPDPAEPTVTFVDYTEHALTIVSGTPWQNETGQSVVVALPVEYAATDSAAASLNIALAAASPGSEGALEASFAENSLAITLVHRIIVPPTWWLRADAVEATIVAGTYQAVAA
jgi:hypothetical protein